MTDEERAGLLKVAEVLETQDRHVVPGYSQKGSDAPEPLLFNMGVRASHYDCGTVACIGGFLSLYLQGVDISRPVLRLTKEQTARADAYVDDFSFVSYHEGASGSRVHEPLEALFYPSMDDNVPNYGAITSTQAAKAIRNFLEHGDPRWVEVI